MSQNKSVSAVPRRRFLKTLAAGATLSIPGWSAASGSLYLPEELPLTPRQTEGPFYPETSIEKQLHNDTNLVRKVSDHVAAQGQQIVVSGTVRDRRGAPIKGAIVEIWQACADGRYNHSRDDSGQLLDNNFQFWGRSLTGKDGKYQFLTIIPGRYPGRHGRHIHYRVDAPGHRRLTTQCYFDPFGEDNARDGIYMDLSRKERELLTVKVDKSGVRAALKKAENKERQSSKDSRKTQQSPAKNVAAKPVVWKGTFDVVLAKA
ncbi:MAG: protocatechuate 3,4-dioxygenase [Planctomycetota bacterium]